ncbi:hypothetical protein Cgig2_021418 [Carnegiea gigantea]|uniref:Uncharacterized protein n=1 Tax=Carnegiea gigantea TaxID=171969 RepID=A0A9Q1GRL0_9CARY|nr:hypothetical protein Cgig2_021418 [Carnegiea gigantea]
MRCFRTQYTWTNNHVWSRINRVLINMLYCNGIQGKQIRHNLYEIIEILKGLKKLLKKLKRDRFHDSCRLKKLKLETYLRESIGDFICGVSFAFFTNYKIRKSYSATCTCEIPRVLSSLTAKEFIPISHCIVMCKCIFKVLCSRLKEVLPCIIDTRQKLL